MSGSVYEWTNEEIAAALAAYQSAPDTAKAGDLRALMDQARRSVQFTPPPTDLAGVRARIVEAFVAAAHDTWDEEWYGPFDRTHAVNTANTVLDRYPHVAEGWPTA